MRQGQPEQPRLDPRQVARTLLRPGAYAGVLREVALTGVHLASYPLGLFPPRQEPLAAAAGPDPDATRLPVVLVHGFIHNRSAFRAMSRALEEEGFGLVHGLNYNPVGASIPELAESLGEEVDRALEASGASACQIVGHSMGGIIARYYAQELARPGTLDTVITIATPHRGTYSARLGRGPAISALRPGSALLRRLEEGARPSGTRWVSFYSDLDLMVLPPASAKLVHPALNATNVRIRNTGHLSLLLSTEVIAGVIEHLSDRALDRSGGQRDTTDGTVATDTAVV